MDFIAFRKELHRHPELSGQEYQTSERVQSALKQLHVDTIISPIGKTGVAAIIDSGLKGKTVMFRAELDALPINEDTHCNHESLIKGVSHQCGHDGHMVILLRLASKIVQYRFRKGKVILLFQPAEETGEGAQWVLEDSDFQHVFPDVIYALHNVPGLPMGEIFSKPELFTPWVISVAIRFKGIVAHASEPEKGLNPLFAMIQLNEKVMSLSSADKDKMDFVLITPVHIRLGDKDYGISPDQGELHYTIRSWSSSVLEEIKSKINFWVNEVHSIQNMKCELEWTHPFGAVKNDLSAVQIIRKSTHEAGLTFHELDKPNPWGEDFGLFTQRIRGAMFCIGSGEKCAPLHSGKFDFPDELIETGADLFFHILINEMTE
ncbi:MAG TPA: amidohydrolase [Saprospiraceae bacterium]|nr:amidohydrolase [Saprospiraceae bacterium]